MAHHILLLGATGNVGSIFIQAALEGGHRLTLYVRSPEKLPAETRSHDKVTVFKGTLEDKAALEQVATCGADVFVSFAGPTQGAKTGTPITQALQILYPALIKSNPSIRIMTLCTASHSDPHDGRSLKWWLVVNALIRLTGGDTYPEAHGIGKTTAALGGKADWTLFRVPILNGDKLDENPGDLNACYIGDKNGRDGMNLDRGRMARWVLEEIDARKWVRAAPFISNK